MNLIKLPFSIVFYLIRWIFFLLLLPFRLFARLFARNNKTLLLRINEKLLLTKPEGIQGVINKAFYLNQIERAISDAANSGVIHRIIVEIKQGTLTRSELLILRDTIHRCKGGITVDLALNQARLSIFELSTTVDNILMNPAEAILAIPPQIESKYFKTLLKKVGIEMQSVHVGDYKTAYNGFTRAASSIPEKVAMRDLSDGLRSLVEAPLQKRLGEKFPIKTFLYEKAYISARSALTYGLIDKLVYSKDLHLYAEEPELFDYNYSEKNGEDQTKEKHHKSDGFEAMDALESMKDLPHLLDWDKKRIKIPEWKFRFKRRKCVGILALSGAIIDDEGPSALGGGGAVITPTVVRERVKELLENGINGILLKITSPGGSATASEEIWHLLSELRKHLPIVAYCQDVAASGGYYLACSASHIYCHESSIVGSIGVVSAQICAAELLKKLEIGHEVHAEKFPSPFQQFAKNDAASTKILFDMGREFYQTFLNRVGRARQIDKRSLHRYARGRVYLGNQALYRNLVDGVDGYYQALEKLKSLMGSDDDVTLIEVNNEMMSLKTVLKSQLASTDSDLREVAVEVARLTGLSASAQTELHALFDMMSRNQLLAYSDVRANLT